VEALSEDVRKRLSEKHSLQWLWDQLRVTVERSGTKLEDVEAISSYIQQVNEIDPESVGFRYATEIEDIRINRTRYRSTEERWVYSTSRRQWSGAYCLENFDGYFADMIEGDHELLAEACDSP
jgi:Asp-tRNA(Asn)/Glu-tRNA(Gln) amidotransferase C subunit